MLIATKQLEPVGLTLFVQQAMSGGALSGNLQPYFAASGFLGNHVVYTTGGAQIIAGAKTFLTSPSIPYYGGTGSPPAALWVNDQLNSVSGTITGGLVTTTTVQTITATKTFTLPIFVGAPSNTGHAITLGFLTGVSGVLASGVGGGSSVIVTGSTPISPARFTGNGSVVLIYDGTYINVSGTAQGGTTPPGIVYTTGNQTILDQKIFTGNPLIASPTLPSGAVNVIYASGLSGALQVQITGMTGFNVYNTYFISGTGTVNLSYTATGSINNVFNNVSGTINNNTNYLISGVTGNFVNMSFYFDEFNLSTGLNLIEAFVGRSFIFTGFAVGVWASGTQGTITGNAYQRDRNNTKQSLFDFYLNSGVFTTGVGGFLNTVTGLNRVGLSIFNVGTGFTGLSIGIFGMGY